MVDASVAYSTTDGTALAGQDYVSTTGTAIIRAGQNSVVIGVEIIGDSIPELDETFFLTISDPTEGIFSSGSDTISAMHTIVDDDLFIPASLILNGIIV